MSIWVRSQDKKSLTKAINIALDIPLSSGETGIKGYFNNNKFEILGYYKSKERAIEVLDELQAHLENNYLSIDNMPQYSNGLIANGLNLFSNNKQTVYQMPEF